MSGLTTFSLDSVAEEACTRCEVLPTLAYGSGRLHLRVPVAYTLGKARSTLRETGWAFVEDARGVFSIDVPNGSYEPYCATLRAAFTTIELAAIRAVFVDEGQPASMADYLEADSLQRVVERSRAGALIETLADGGMTAAFQPICDAHTLAVHGYEALLRFQPGAPIGSLAEFFSVAKACDLLPQVDLAARRTIIDVASRYSFSGRLFINFVPTSIYDVKTCLRSTIGALDEIGVDHGRVVFEVVESEEVEDVDHLTNIMKAYRASGFKVALDDLGSGFASLNLLHRLRPDYVKLDIALVRDVDVDPFKAMLAAKLIEAANALELTVIAEGVETAGELTWMREHGADLIQGFLLARPAAVPIAEIPNAAAHRAG